MKQYRSLKRSQFASRDELRTLQFQKVERALEHADEHIPYYQKLFKQIGFDPRDFKQLDDLRHIPPLTRNDLIEHRHELVDARWQSAIEKADNSSLGPGAPLPFAIFRGKPLVRNRSSGSTGAPTIFYENGSISAASWATELLLRDWFGIPPGAREARIARVSIDYVTKTKSVALRRLLWNQLALPGSSLTEEDFAFAAKAIFRFRPRVIWGGTPPLVGLSDFLKSHPGLFPEPGPDLLITWSTPLYEHEQATLTEAFQCPVSNIYGCREVGHIAAMCEAGSMHINQEAAYLEEESPHSDEPSELLATTLTPTPMPFIRYRMGDLGRLTDSSCSCGKNLQVLEEITGRTSEVFTNSEGRMIAPGFWCHTFEDIKLGNSVKRFQIVYRPNKRILIRIVRGESYTSDTESHLKTSIIANLFPGAMIDFEYPNDIHPTVSGKYQMVVNETGVS